MPTLEIIASIIFGFILFVYWGITFIILYHLTRFGIGVQPKRFAAIFVFGSVVLSSVVIVLFTTLDITSILPQ